jgi:hypothetical protein
MAVARGRRETEHNVSATQHKHSLYQLSGVVARCTAGSSECEAERLGGAHQPSASPGGQGHNMDRSIVASQDRVMPAARGVGRNTPSRSWDGGAASSQG